MRALERLGGWWREVVIYAFVNVIERGRICCSIREWGDGGAQLSEKPAKMAHSDYVYATVLYHDVLHPAATSARWSRSRGVNCS